MRYWILVLTSILILSSCKKDAGEGGSSTINGNVTTVEYSIYSSKLVRSYNANEEDVYIIYGDNEYYGDRVRTDNNGNFEFNYLTKGEYTIYAYSDDTLNYDLKTTENVNAKINSNNSTVTTQNITIVKMVDKGNANITGMLFAYDYDASLTILKDTFYVADEYVYIAIKGESTYFDRIKTFYDGSFVFSELLPGKYEVYAYSKANTASEMVAIKTDVEITDFNQSITIPRIEIIK
jgi:hypothetical protein